MGNPIKYDVNGDPFLFTRGDMGTFAARSNGHLNSVTGEDIMARTIIPGTAKFTGASNGDASPALALNHPEIFPDDIPTGWRWPASLGPDPR